MSMPRLRWKAALDGVNEQLRERNRQLEEQARLGAYYVSDAFAGRLEHGMAKMSLQPEPIFLAFRLQTSDAWLRVLVCCNLIHALLVFAEEPNACALARDGGWRPRRPDAARLLELGLIFVYATDVTLKAAYMGWAEYMSKPWQKLFAVVVGVLLLDAITLSPVRLARPLRPAVLCLRARSVRRFFTVIRNMVPGVLHVCVPLVFFLLLSSSFGAAAFGGGGRDGDGATGKFGYHNGGDGTFNSGGIGGSNGGNGSDGAKKPPWRTPGAAGYNLWILIVCMENYEELLRVADGAFHDGVGGGGGAGGGNVFRILYLCFFFITLAVGHIFLLSLLMGITHDVFIEHTKAQVKSERLKELKGLTKAFATLDPEGTGKLEREMWDKFLQHLMPVPTKPEERVLLFEIASSFGDDLDVIAFLDLRQVLNYRFERAERLLGHQFDVSPGATAPLRRVAARATKAIAALRARSSFTFGLAAVVLIDCALLPYTAPGRLEAMAGSDDGGGSDGEWDAPATAMAVRVLAGVCSAALLLETLVNCVGPSPRVAAQRWFGRLSDHEKTAAVAVLLHAVLSAFLYSPLLPLLCDAGNAAATVTTAEAAAATTAAAAREASLRRMVEGAAYALRLLRCWRLVTLNPLLHKYVLTFFHILPVFCETLSFALIIAYSFATFAMDTFGGDGLYDGGEDGDGYSRGDGGAGGRSGGGGGGGGRGDVFAAPGQALLTMIQLFFGVNFKGVVEDTWESAGGWRALLFFMAYHIIGVLIVFNLINAIIIQFYSETLNERSMKHMEEQRRLDAALQTALFDHVRAHDVIKKWGGGCPGLPLGAMGGIGGMGGAGGMGFDGGLTLARRSPNVTGRELRRVLGVGRQGESITEEDLRKCQKYSKVDLVAALKERREGERSLKEFERGFYHQVKNSLEPTVMSFADGALIFEAGAPHRFCYFVQHGKVLLIDRDGKEQLKDVGEMFGDTALLWEDLPQPVTARAAGNCECLAVTRKAFEEHYTEDVSTIGHLARKLQRAGSLDPVAFAAELATQQQQQQQQQHDGLGLGLGGQTARNSLQRSCCINLSATRTSIHEDDREDEEEDNADGDDTFAAGGGGGLSGSAGKRGGGVVAAAAAEAARPGAAGGWAGRHAVLLGSPSLLADRPPPARLTATLFSRGSGHGDSRGGGGDSGRSGGGGDSGRTGGGGDSGRTGGGGVDDGRDGGGAGGHRAGGGGGSANNGIGSNGILAAGGGRGAGSSGGTDDDGGGTDSDSDGENGEGGKPAASRRARRKGRQTSVSVEEETEVVGVGFVDLWVADGGDGGDRELPPRRAAQRRSIRQAAAAAVAATNAVLGYGGGPSPSEPVAGKAAINCRSTRNSTYPPR